MSMSVAANYDPCRQLTSVNARPYPNRTKTLTLVLSNKLRAVHRVDRCAFSAAMLNDLWLGLQLAYNARIR